MLEAGFPDGLSRYSNKSYAGCYILFGAICSSKLPPVRQRGCKRARDGLLWFNESYATTAAFVDDGNLVVFFVFVDIEVMVQVFKAKHCFLCADGAHCELPFRSKLHQSILFPSDV